MPAKAGPNTIKRDPPPVGVMAATQNIALSLARELNIFKAVALSPNSNAGRGVNLAVLLVDESVWPLKADVLHRVLPSLAHHQGYILKVSRLDPRRPKRVP